VCERQQAAEADGADDLPIAGVSPAVARYTLLHQRCACSALISSTSVEEANARRLTVQS